MDITQFIDANATGALQMAASHATNVHCLSKVNPEELGKFYVIWRTKQTVLTLSINDNLPNHNKDQKIKNIEFFKTVVINSTYVDTTLFTMRKDQNSPAVIIDGIHRSIGIIKAYQQDADVQSKLNIRIVLFEGSDIGELDDYKLSIPLN